MRAGGYDTDSLCVIGFFDFVSFYLQYTNLYNFIYVTQDWSYRNLTYFASCQTLSLTVFGIVGGTLMAKYRDVKVCPSVRNTSTWTDSTFHSGHSSLVYSSVSLV